MGIRIVAMLAGILYNEEVLAHFASYQYKKRCTSHSIHIPFDFTSEMNNHN